MRCQIDRPVWVEGLDAGEVIDLGIDSGIAELRGVLLEATGEGGEGVDGQWIAVPPDDAGLDAGRGVQRCEIVLCVADLVHCGVIPERVEGVRNLSSGVGEIGETPTV